MMGILNNKIRLLFIQLKTWQKRSVEIHSQRAPIASIGSRPQLRNAPGSKQGHARAGVSTKKRVPAGLIRRFRRFAQM